MTAFTSAPIAGVLWKSLPRFKDERGWLCELFRHDELPGDFRPVMAYLSETLPGVWRGPHEHREQTDCFCFVGPSMFEMRLWDNRTGSATYWHCETEHVGADRPMLVIVPPGVVHAYRNIGTVPGLIFNCPDRLYRGDGKRAEVDEIRHEADRDSPFRIE